jgi:hypothetical protein
MVLSTGRTKGAMMRRFATTLGFGFSFLLGPSCEQGYPIPPTLCDRVCESRQRLHCRGEDPVSCVDECEVSRVPRCESRLSALTNCVMALPISEFWCEDDATHRTLSTCSNETQLLQTCLLRETSGWRSLCDDWVTQCISGDGDPSGDAGTDVWLLYMSCVSRYQAAEGSCGAPLQEFVDCLDLHEQSCSTSPADSDACPAQKSALDTCDGPLREMCQNWSNFCRTFDGSRDPGAISEQRCLESHPVETGSRCAQERRALYKCAADAWSMLFLPARCDAPPLAQSSCGAERSAFDACAASSVSDGGAAR